jgi:hypothetical protein
MPKLIQTYSKLHIATKRGLTIEQNKAGLNKTKFNSQTSQQCFPIQTFNALLLNELNGQKDPKLLQFKVMPNSAHRCSNCHYGSFKY